MTRVELLTQKLAEDILDGRLKPGAKLDEQGLADRFGVSRTPVREAIGQLVAMGMLEKRPHVGAVVRQVTAERLSQMFEVMAELEAACARLAAERMTAAELGELLALHEETRIAVENGDHEAYEVLNRRFHNAIYSGTHNDMLVDTTLEARRRVAPYRRAQFSVAGRVAASYDEHGDVVAGIRRRDGERAYQAMRAHIRTVKDASMSYVAQTLNLDTDRS
ncbi:GntR family transcriptional regulator [Minwuia thermotolerans]|uniref:GntR family transcriptional regulator n=1 Tax=Minwuia thermotolerans TaxID=2056226 RepID=A0A2M9G3Q5_9PROT|nr:GntR family transcriptional regulator [Minwuia thermotolerans]PJK30343.1 GntR family transcriptional regulator [Minwuia thermotolerans]